MEKIVFDRDPQIPEALRLQYLRRREADLITLNRAEQMHDLESIEQLAHRMKGNGATFGFPELSDLGAALESAAQDHDQSRIRTLLDELSEIITNRLKSASSG